MLALPMMMIRQAETASRRQLRVGVTVQGGLTYIGFVQQTGTGTLNDQRIFGRNGNASIIVAVQNVANNNTYLQIQHNGTWTGDDVFGLVNVTRGVELSPPSYTRTMSSTVREWGWETGTKDLGLVLGETDTILVLAKGVGW